MFTSLRTPRLLIRPFVAEDAAGLAARRNDPDVARYQNWTRPFPLERAERMVAELTAMDGPTDGEWWMAVVCDLATGQVFGDLAVELTWQARTAEVGYTFAAEHWGRGYAVEALAALVEYLFEEVGITRQFGMLHPDNPASAQVLERCGFLFEGHTRLSFWVDDDCSDDWIYGLTRADWDAWSRRPRHPAADIRLVPVTTDNADQVARLRTHKTQEAFVAPMLWSFTDALFPEVVDGAPVVPWLRAIEADGDLVGFVMVAERTQHHPEPYLWRLLVDRLHQRRGIGARVLDLVAEESRRMGGTALLTSWSEGRGSPRPFYERNGFAPTGRIVDGETEAARPLPTSS